MLFVARLMLMSLLSLLLRYLINTAFLKLSSTGPYSTHCGSCSPPARQSIAAASNHCRHDLPFGDTAHSAFVHRPPRPVLSEVPASVHPDMSII